MRRVLTIILSFLILIISSSISNAAPGDTVKVRTIEFKAPRAAWFDFPTPDSLFRKVLMNYKLRCPEGKQCGEWDYIANVFVHQFFAPSFRVNGLVADTFSYSNTATKRRIPYYQYFRYDTTVTREGLKNSKGGTILEIGKSDKISNVPLKGESERFLVQFLWRASDLTAAGNLPGNITAMRLKVNQSGSAIKGLRIKLKNTKSSELSEYIEQNLSEVFYSDVEIGGNGWKDIQFYKPFVWDSSNLLVEISADANQSGQSSQVAAGDANYNSMIEALDMIKYLYFNGRNTKLETYSRLIADKSNELTLSLWVRPGSVSNWDGLITAAGSANFTGIAFGNQISDGVFAPQFRIMNEGIANSSITLDNNEWTHIAAVWKSGAFQRIFINGELAGEAASPFAGELKIDSKWIIGQDRTFGDRFFEGQMKNIQIWNKALDQSIIKEWMNKPPDNSHPNKSNLLVYYEPQNTNGYKAVADLSGNKNHAAVFGDFEFTFNSENNSRQAVLPLVIFEQGEYKSSIAKKFSKVIESSNLEYELVHYSNESEPTKPTKTEYFFPAGYYNYSYDNNGNPVDSVKVQSDGNLVLTKSRVYFEDAFTITDQFEIMRYITPYGNPTADGNVLSDGNTFNWVMDLTDFRLLLGGKVFIWAPNGQEDLELTFDFIEGTPSRNIIGFRKMWNMDLTYDKLIENYLTPINVKFENNEKAATLKVIQTGHGFGGTSDNCAEFCRKEAFVKVDDEERFRQWIWRECGDNPLYPQGGTWLTDRTNWCPGAEVVPHDYNITPFIQSGKSFSIDYDMEYYAEDWVPGGPGSNTRPNWVIRSYLITYSEPNFKLDASIEDIISPSNKDLFLRFNPICTNPIIIIRNNGSIPLTKLKINYGIMGLDSAEYLWSGNLPFLASDTVNLPSLNWMTMPAEPVFNVRISEPNGGKDEYEYDNFAKSNFEATPIYNAAYELVVDLKTSNYDVFGEASPYRWSIADESGNIVAERANTENNARYLDTLRLGEGCYTLLIQNLYGFGFGYWPIEPPYNQLKRGAMQITNGGKIVSNFKKDFGNTIFHQFRMAERPKAVLSSENIDFGKIKLGESLQKVLEVSPDNETGLLIYDVKIILGEKRGYYIDSTSPAIAQSGTIINKGERLNIYITFKPDKAGNSSTSLTLNTNDDINPMSSVKLTGFGESETDVNEDNTEDNHLSIEVEDNPVSGLTNIYFNSMNGKGLNMKLELFDAMGNFVMTLFDGLNHGKIFQASLNPAEIADGIYYLRLSCNNSSKAVPVIIIK